MALGIQAKPMLFLATVYKWQTNQPEGWKRVRSATGTSYVLNANRIDGLQVKTVLGNTRCSLYYFDNPFDNRDNSHYMEISDHTVTQVVAHMDTVPTHTHMDLSVYPNMDRSETPVTTVIPIDNFAFAVAVEESDYATTQSFVYYVDSGWRFKRCRVNHTLAQILTLIT